MPWYNPLTWFDLDGGNAENIAASNYDLYQMVLADYQAGAITEAEWTQWLAIYMNSTGGVIPESKEAAVQIAKEQVNTIINDATLDALSNPLAAPLEALRRPGADGSSTMDKLMTALKWLAIAAAVIIAIFGLNAFTKAGRFITGRDK